MAPRRSTDVLCLGRFEPLPVVVDVRRHRATSAPAKTWGWRRTILSARSSATSSMVNRRSGRPPAPAGRATGSGAAGRRVPPATARSRRSRSPRPSRSSPRAGTGTSDWCVCSRSHGHARRAQPVLLRELRFKTTSMTALFRPRKVRHPRAQAQGSSQRFRSAVR